MDMSVPKRFHDPSRRSLSPFIFDSIPEAITAFSQGAFVVIMDDEGRENEGDLVCAASKVTTERMAFMVRWTRCVMLCSMKFARCFTQPTSTGVDLSGRYSGFICLSLPPARLTEIDLPPLLTRSGVNQDPKGTAYHMTFDANASRHPVTTGISAHDRAYAARLMASGGKEDDITRPGHLVTLRYTSGGTRKRRGHTEAAVGESDDEGSIGVMMIVGRPLLSSWRATSRTAMRAASSDGSAGHHG